MILEGYPKNDALDPKKGVILVGKVPLGGQKQGFGGQKCHFFVIFRVFRGTGGQKVTFSSFFVIFRENRHFRILSDRVFLKGAIFIESWIFVFLTVILDVYKKVF